MVKIDLERRLRGSNCLHLECVKDICKFCCIFRPLAARKVLFVTIFFSLKNCLKDMLLWHSALNSDCQIKLPLENSCWLMLTRFLRHHVQTTLVWFVQEQATWSSPRWLHNQNLFLYQLGQQGAKLIKFSGIFCFKLDIRLIIITTYGFSQILFFCW